MCCFVIIVVEYQSERNIFGEFTISFCTCTIRFLCMHVCVCACMCVCVCVCACVRAFLCVPGRNDPAHTSAIREFNRHKLCSRPRRTWRRRRSFWLRGIHMHSHTHIHTHTHIQCTNKSIAVEFDLENYFRQFLFALPFSCPPHSLCISRYVSVIVARLKCWSVLDKGGNPHMYVYICTLLCVCVCLRVCVYAGWRHRRQTSGEEGNFQKKKKRRRRRKYNVFLCQCPPPSSLASLLPPPIPRRFPFFFFTTRLRPLPSWLN